MPKYFLLKNKKKWLVTNEILQNANHCISLQTRKTRFLKEFKSRKSEKGHLFLSIFEKIFLELFL